MPNSASRKNGAATPGQRKLPRHGLVEGELPERGRPRNRAIWPGQNRYGLGMTILVTGGAGYIGAHVVAALREDDRGVVVVDDLSSGQRERVQDVPLFELDIAAPQSAEALAAIMAEHRVDAVIHLAAKKRVDQSVRKPLYYYQQNLTGLSNLLAAVCRTGVRRLVFSSSAAVYGETSAGQVSEQAPTEPVNPYGRTKLVGEWMCSDLANTGALDVVLLRYFNVAGAAGPELRDPTVQNLVTIVIDQLNRGRQPVIFGADYPTADGTCVRDFVHVVDLADAHVAALAAMEAGAVTGSAVFNVGTGEGGSVRAVVEQLISLSGMPLIPVVEGRRPGDPASVVAAVDLIRERFGWTAKAGLAEILVSAWAAQQPRSSH